ncbi:MAG: hypothetical protein ACYSU0_11495 [Planctomycetota bacterium]|jgi:hypothetical protein
MSLKEEPFGRRIIATGMVAEKKTSASVPSERATLPVAFSKSRWKLLLSIPAGSVMTSLPPGILVHLSVLLGFLKTSSHVVRSRSL